MAGKAGKGGIVRQVSKPDGRLPAGPTRTGTLAAGGSPWSSPPLAPQRGSVVHYPTDRPNKQRTPAPRAMGSNV